MVTTVSFYDAQFMPGRRLTYSVIASLFGDRWIFVRHCDRTTWEIPGGHIEDGESPSDAAGRELMEETGAEQFELHCVATYSVEKEGRIGFGRLFYAKVSLMGQIPDKSEIAEVQLMDHLPEYLTYPDIQPILFARALEYLKEKGTSQDNCY